MGRRANKRDSLGPEELRGLFTGPMGDKFPPILSPEQFADLLNVSRSTVYHWIARGRFRGACRRRGKHRRILRDRALQTFFFGPEWDRSGENGHD